MNDATIEQKEIEIKTKDFSSVEEIPEVIEPIKPNRHERRKRAKLARIQAMKDRLEKEKLSK